MLSIPLRMMSERTHGVYMNQRFQIFRKSLQRREKVFFR